MRKPAYASAFELYQYLIESFPNWTIPPPWKWEREGLDEFWAQSLVNYSEVLSQPRVRNALQKRQQKAEQGRSAKQRGADQGLGVVDGGVEDKSFGRG